MLYDAWIDLCFSGFLLATSSVILWLCYAWGFNFMSFYLLLRGPPCCLSGEELACHCRRHRFNLWVKKISWRRKWKPSPLFLPGKSHGRRSLVGYSPWHCRRVGIYLVSKQQHLLLKYRKTSLWVFACLWSLFSISLSVFFLPHEGQSIWM